MRRLIILLINFYRNYLFYFKLPTCRFYPTCSSYFLQSVERYGLYLGLKKGLWRIIRCHPFSRGGFDPVE